MPDQCYFNGNYYQCVTATNAGESPATHPAKWRQIQLPKAWRWALAQLTYAELLKMDGQNDKALFARDEATGAQDVGVEDLIRKEANREAHRLSRPDVRSPY